MITDRSALSPRLALAALMLHATQILGCGCGSAQERSNSMQEHSAVASSSSHAPSSTNLPSSSPEDPRKMTLVLHDPRLEAVRIAMDKKDMGAASLALRDAMTKHAPQGIDRARWSYLLGSLLHQSKDTTGAALAFDDAASFEYWILHDYASLAAAQAYTDLEKYEEASKRLSSVGNDLPITSKARLLRADILDAMGKTDDALLLWREHLAAEPSGIRWEQGALRLARGLLEGAPDSNRAVDALQWLRRVMSEVPTSPQAQEAELLEKEALARLSPGDRTKFGSWPVEVRMRRAQVLSDRGRRSEAKASLSSLLDDLDEAGRRSLVGCEATALQAKLLGLDKSTRPRAADTYSEALQRCAKHPTQLPSVLYFGARMHTQVNRLASASAMYARLEKEFPAHRLADDARWRGARLAQLMRDERKFESMLLTMGHDYPDGDMVEDGLFDLALNHMEKGNWAKAIEPLETSIRVRGREKKHHVSGRALYFLGRAHEATGKTEQAHEAFQKVIGEHPLSYYMMLAYSRLRSRKPALAVESLQRAETPSEDPSPELPDKLKTKGFERAVELLRLGEVALGRGEVVDLGLQQNDGDAMVLIASLYARAGDARLAHQVVRTRTEDWCTSYPKGRWQQAWKLAYPQMYLDIVNQQSDAFRIPRSLAYGIMREESAFDASAVSWANAYGLMQLIMPTAKGVAQSLQIKVDEDTLKRPEVNIRLGCKFLGSLRGMFPTAPVMAIPSYNAGAGATKRWLKNRTSDDFDLWVESIPYDETRDYTKRVLSTIAVYAYLYDPNDLPIMLQLPDQLDL